MLNIYSNIGWNNQKMSNKIFDKLNNVVSLYSYNYKNFLDYSCFKQFQNDTLSKYELLNENDILDFIECYPSLIKLIDIVTKGIVEIFSENELKMEFVQDPEINEFNHIILYIVSSDESFDKDWELLKDLKNELRQIELLDNSIKSLLMVDLW